MTFFIFSDVLAEAIDNEFSGFDPASLLFLKNIISLRLMAGSVVSYKVIREDWINPFSFIQIECNEHLSNWILTKGSNVSVAFFQDQSTERVEALSARDAVVHAFLPTHEPTGLGIKINGDISTDPSRTRVVFDERTADGLLDIAALVSEIIFDILSDKPLPDSLGMLSALLPLEDPRLYQYQKKSFKSELFKSLQLKCKLDSFSLCPSWFNPLDFELLGKHSGLKILPRAISDVPGASSLMRYLGAKDLGFKDLSKTFSKTGITQNGCAEIIAEIVRLTDTKQIRIDEVDPTWPICISEGRNTSIQQISKDNLNIDEDFIDLVTEKTTGLSSISRLIAALSDQKTASRVIPIAEPAGSAFDEALDYQACSPASAPSLQQKSLSLKKWRGAEEQVKNIFTAQGWRVDDVSRQNIGYDLECEHPDGRKLYIEVKLIASPSQPFILTSNEEVVARQKGNLYQMAIVKESGDFLEVFFISDPISNLKLTRQCRQWVWECSEYPYQPIRFKLE